MNGRPRKTWKSTSDWRGDALPRVIDIQVGQELPSALDMRVGDLLMFAASGGHILEGGAAVELLGSFTSSVISDEGSVLTPLGPPNVVLFRGRRPGRAQIDVIRGDPWQGSPQAQQIEIVVTL